MRAGLLAILAAGVLCLSACDEVVDSEQAPPPVVERQPDAGPAQAPAPTKPRIRRLSDAEMQAFIRKHEDEIIMETEGVVRYRNWVAERQPSGDWIGYRP